MGFICSTYTAIGGLKAVVWTDVVQLILMVFGLIVVVVKVIWCNDNQDNDPIFHFQGTVDVGGVEELFKRSEMGSRIKLIKWV